MDFLNYEVEIERLRKELIKVAEKEGLHAKRTVKISHELDLLINKFEKQKKRKFF